MPITHKKTTPIPSLTQPQLDAAIAAGQYPAGTTLADIVLSEDWNDDHDFTGLAETDQNQSWVAQGQRIGTTANGGLTIASNVITLNLGAFNAFDLGTLAAGAYTLANPTGLSATVSYKGDIKLTTPASGSVTIAYGSAWDFNGGTAPTVPTTNNATVFYDYASHSATNVRLSVPQVFS